MKRAERKYDESTASVILGKGIFPFIGCLMFSGMLFVLYGLDFIPEIILMLASFITFMTAGYSLTVVFGACFSMLPFWCSLHGAFFHKKADWKFSASSQRESGVATFLRGISLFALIIAWLNIFVIVWGFYSYYSAHAEGKVTEITYRNSLILGNGQKITNPIDKYAKRFPSLKPIELGDTVKKEYGSLDFFVNGNVYFNNGMFWKQELYSDSFVFMLVGVCLGLILATVYKIFYPDKLLNYFDTSNRRVPEKERIKEEDKYLQPRLSRQLKEHNCANKNDFGGMMGEYLEFTSETPNSLSRISVFIIFTFFCFSLTLIMSQLFPAYFVIPATVCLLGFVIATILKSGVNRLLIHKTGVEIDRGAWFLRKRQSVDARRIKGMKAAPDSFSRSYCLNLELHDATPVVLWGDLEKKLALKQAEKIENAFKTMIPDLIMTHSDTETKDSRLTTYRAFGQLLILSGIMFTLLPLIGLSPRFSEMVPPGGLFWLTWALWSMLYGLTPLVCGWRINRGDRSAVLFALLLIPIMLSWILPIFINGYPVFLGPWVGVVFAFICFGACVVGFWGWKYLPSADKNGAHIPVFRIWYIPFLIIALLGAIGLWKLEKAKGELLSAIQHGEKSKVEKLLFDPFISLGIRADRRKTLAHLAVESGSSDTLELVLKAGVNPNVKSQNVNYPIHLAAEKGRSDMIELLLKYNADVNAENLFEKTVLHIAARNNDLKTARLVLDNGADPVKKSSTGVTPLHEAAASGSRKIAELLLRHGADINQKDELGNTPLIAAARKGRGDMVLFLLRHGANEGLPVIETILTKKNKEAVSNIFLACAVGKLNLVQKLLDNNPALVNKKDSKGWTPLHWAALNGNPDIIKLLIEKGSDKNAMSLDKLTPMDILRTRKHKEMQIKPQATRSIP